VRPDDLAPGRTSLFGPSRLDLLGGLPPPSPQAAVLARGAEPPEPPQLPVPARTDRRPEPPLPPPGWPTRQAWPAFRLL